MSNKLKLLQNSRPRKVNREEKLAMNKLRKSCPSIFDDPEIQGLSMIVLEKLPEELGNMRPVARISAILAIIALMYDMASAGIAATKVGERRRMGQILIDKKLAEKNKNKI